MRPIRKRRPARCDLPSKPVYESGGGEGTIKMRDKGHPRRGRISPHAG
jgi:hypothetical protein